jgi:hypothetical protein
MSHAHLLARPFMLLALFAVARRSLPVVQPEARRLYRDTAARGEGLVFSLFVAAAVILLASSLAAAQSQFW